MTEDMPGQRRAALQRIIRCLRDAESIVITTHVNADGDGTGSEVAMAAWLTSLGKRVSIVNPTAYPAAFRFLVPEDGLIADAGTVAADKAIADADLLLVVDTAEASRIGRVAKVAAGRDVVIIDHHVATDSMLRGETLQDVLACATGELVWDLLNIAEYPRPWPLHVCEALYAAIVTDTGSFRYSNTTRRAHLVAGDLIDQGVNPELMYRRIYATVPLRRIELLRHALERLHVDPEYPISSIAIERGVMEKLGAGSEDLDGVVEHARSIEGTEVAILFRETSDGGTKVSLRSAGAADVNAVARQFGGGGHVKASGALIGQPMTEAMPRVLEATRAALRDAGLHFRTAPSAG